MMYTLDLTNEEYKLSSFTSIPYNSFNKKPKSCLLHHAQVKFKICNFLKVYRISVKYHMSPYLDKNIGKESKSLL